MTMMTLKCPNCSAEAKLSLADTDYVGPRRCWKCHEFFTITIRNNQVVSCEPLSKEEYDRQQEAKKAAEKSGGGINFSRQEEPGSLPKAAEKPRSGIDISKQAQMEFPQNSPSEMSSSKEEDTDIFNILAGKSKGGINISKQDKPAAPSQPAEKKPELFRPPMPKEPTKPAEPKKKGPLDPPERFQTFVPQEEIKEEDLKPAKPKKGTGYRNPFIPPQT
jgi:hypothetical protein